MLVTLYSFLLIAGMAVSQFLDLSDWRSALTGLTMACLSYIMIEVGLEFTIDKKRLGTYGKDYLVAATAAAFPWIFCAIYFVFVFSISWKESLLIARFAAPTSAGVLFAMLAAAGLGTTWLFRKVRILAIFDDLDTVLFMIPLKILIVGFKPEVLAIIGFILLPLWATYRWLHRVKLPTGRPWLVAYALAVFFLCKLVEHTTNVHLEVLLPAFVVGCLLWNPHDPSHPEKHAREHQHIEPASGWPLLFDRGLKGLFMFLVGCSLPKIQLGDLSWSQVVLHVLAITVISNLGKIYPAFCYKTEASFKERLAVSIAMFPRGEVGAGVLLVAIGYHLDETMITFGALSLALNLLLTGFFITAVIRLIRPQAAQSKP